MSRAAALTSGQSFSRTRSRMTQDELATRSCRRDLADWVVVEKGSSGVSGVYDLWRRLRASISGTEFTPEHQPEKRN